MQVYNTPFKVLSVKSTTHWQCDACQSKTNVKLKPPYVLSYNDNC